MTEILAALDAAGRALFADLALPDGWAYSFADCATGASPSLVVYIDGPGLLLRVRQEPGPTHLYGPCSAALRGGPKDLDCTADTMPALAEAIRAMLGGAE